MRLKELRTKERIKERQKKKKRGRKKERKERMNGEVKECRKKGIQGVKGIEMK